MTSMQLMTTIGLAAALVGGAAVAQASSGQTRAAQGGCGDSAQAARADRHDDDRRDADKRCGDRSQQSHDGRAQGSKPTLLPVANSSRPGQEAYGWQYFSAPRKAYAVVISPSGEYFVSRGEGPRQITGPAGRLLAARADG